MAVGLYKYKGDINDRNSEVVLSESIAFQNFYEKYWNRAIVELKIKYIQDGAEFNTSKLNDIIEELNLLHNWALQNLKDKDLEYMTERIKNLQNVIPNALNSDDTILYIF